MGNSQDSEAFRTIEKRRERERERARDLDHEDVKRTKLEPADSRNRQELSQLSHAQFLPRDLVVGTEAQR